MKLLAKLVLATALVSTVFCASGMEEATESGMLTKLGRGIANVAFGPLELLIRPYDVAQDQGSIAALTYGVLKGVCYTVARVGVGVTDVVTFPFPWPGSKDDPNDVGPGYGPLMRPAWVVDTEHNAFNFFFDDDSIATGD
ncbi:MAG: exosortase system-associated protein, TIGR04073 family [Victivallaceae bacterium]|nr:exosortase system-associated protein, TIGR04073 family [Victivallaceae bacterium]